MAEGDKNDARQPGCTNTTLSPKISCLQNAQLNKDPLSLLDDYYSLADNVTPSRPPPLLGEPVYTQHLPEQ